MKQKKNVLDPGVIPGTLPAMAWPFYIVSSLTLTNLRKLCPLASDLSSNCLSNPRLTPTWRHEAASFPCVLIQGHLLAPCIQVRDPVLGKPCR